MVRRKKGGKGKVRPGGTRREPAKPAGTDEAEAGEGEPPPREGDGAEPPPISTETPSESSPRDGEERPEALPDGATWALPLVRLERRWTWVEARIMFAALIALTLVLCLFFSMRGMKEPITAQEPAGTVFRAMVGAAVLGGLSRLVTRGREDKLRNIATLIAIALGFALAPLWRGVGIAYWDGVFNWLQQGSTLTLFGGLWGLSTRLTMFVGMLGASIAAASGTHINIDVVIRLIPRRLRRPVGISAALATACVCIATSWGFVDHIAITSFKANDKGTAGEKISALGDGLGEMFFAFRRQVGLDLGAISYVIAGERWDDPERMSGREWNTWLEESGYPERYEEDELAKLRAPEAYLDDTWVPFVQLPHHDARAGLLRELFDLITWPLGFLILALRFVLRALLIGSGHVSLRVEGEGDEDEIAPTEEAA